MLQVKSTMFLVRQYMAVRLTGLILFSVLLFLTGSYSASASEDLLSSYKAALHNDPVYLAARYENEALGEGINQARAQLLPNINLAYQDKHTTQDIISSDNEVFGSGKTDFPVEDLTLTLSQPIYNYPAFIRYSQSKKKVKQANTVLEAARQDIVLRVTELYLSVLASQDSVDLAEAEKAALGRQLELADSRLKSGLGRKTDLFDAKARYSDVVASEIEARTVLADSLQGLSVSTGHVANRLARLKEEIELIKPDPLDINIWVDSALQANPGVLNLQHAVDVAHDEIRIQRGGHHPTLNFDVRVNHNTTDGTVFGGGSEVETTDLMFNLTVPIFSGGYTSSKTTESIKRHQKALQELDQARRDVERQMRNSYFSMISSISRVEALNVSVESQQLALEAKKQGFKSGLYTILTVLDAERDLYIAKRDYLQARYDYVIGSLNLKHAAGRISEEDVVSANAWLE